MGIGIFVLLGYFFESALIQYLRQLFMQWAVLLAGAALLIGLVNLISVHWRKLGLMEEGWSYSVVLLLAFIVTLALAGFFRPDNTVPLFIFNNIQYPIETSLMSLLAVTLVLAGFRLVSRQQDIFSLLFVGSALLVLLGTGPWLSGSERAIPLALRDLRAWLSGVWAAGGARGILLGVGLGAAATGLRVLLGADRPYGG